MGFDVRGATIYHSPEEYISPEEALMRLRTLYPMQPHQNENDLPQMIRPTN
jgi:hypothetical protein